MRYDQGALRSDTAGARRARVLESTRRPVFTVYLCPVCGGERAVDSSGGGGESVVALQLCVFAQNLASPTLRPHVQNSVVSDLRAPKLSTYYCWRIHAGALFGSPRGGRPPPGISCAPIAPCPAADSPPYPCGIASAPIISARPIRPP